MQTSTPKRPLPRGNLLPTSTIAEAVAQRAGHVTDLLALRRKIALAYRRTQDEEQRVALDRIDNALAAYNIDIPAIQKSMCGTPHRRAAVQQRA